MKPHTYLENEKGITDAYGSLDVPFFNQPLVKNSCYRTVDGGQLKSQWSQMVSDYEKRNALDEASAGYETHPVETPYDVQLRDLLIKRRKAHAEKAKIKQKEVIKQTSMLHFEEMMLPSTEEVAVTDPEELIGSLLQLDDADEDTTPTTTVDTAVTATPRGTPSPNTSSSGKSCSTPSVKITKRKADVLANEEASFAAAFKEGMQKYHDWREIN